MIPRVMRKAVLSILAGLICLSIIAWAIKPRADNARKTPIIWMSDDNPARHDQIDTFNRLNPQYDLRLDPNNTEMEKVIVQSLAGVGPDLFCCYNGFQLSSYVKSGIAWDVTDKLRDAGIDPRKDLWRGPDPTYTYEGRAYGFPANVAANAIWINKELFDQAGVPCPKGPMTWEQFVPLAQKLTRRDSNGRVQQYGFMFDFRDAWMHFALQWGGRFYSEDGTRCVADSPEAIQATQFMYDLIYKYHVSPTPVEESAMATQGGWGSGVITFFGGAKAAMALGGRWWLCTLRDYKNLRLGAFESPHGPKRVFRGYGKGVIINRNSPRREDAFKFLLYMNGKEYNDLINHQADALCPVKRYCYSEEYLHDPKYPKEDFNEVWRDIMGVSEPETLSPFVNGAVADRILTKQLDLVKADQKPVADAMRATAAKVNEEIAKALENDPVLRRRFDQLTAGPGAKQ